MTYYINTPIVLTVLLYRHYHFSELNSSPKNCNTTDVRHKRTETEKDTRGETIRQRRTDGESCNMFPLTDE